MAKIAGCLGATLLPLFLFAVSRLAFTILLAAVLLVKADTLICCASYRATLNSLKKLKTGL